MEKDKEGVFLNLNVNLQPVLRDESLISIPRNIGAGHLRRAKILSTIMYNIFKINLGPISAIAITAA